MKLFISTNASVKLPSHIVGVCNWQSASHRLDAELADICKKLGTHISFIDTNKDRYMGAVVSKKPLSKKDVKFLQDNWDSLVEPE